MKFFNLPDLGEGIPEADIVEWHIQEGEHVKEDQIIVSVETAKAIVEVPSPVTAEVARLCGQPGDTILTGAPLVEFVSEEEDLGTVVGELEVAAANTTEDESFFIGSPPSGATMSQPANGSVHDLASSLGMTQAAPTKQSSQTGYALENPEPLKGVRKHMANTMTQSHAEVVPVTLFDDADIDHWKDGEDITVRLIQAVVKACQSESALNAWFDGSSMSREVFDSVHLGLAVDSDEGLFVPVIRAAETLDGKQLRHQVNTFRTAVKERSLPPSEMAGATITLSNFGVFAGKYATPVVVPPMVCIVGIGKLRAEIVSINGQPASHKVLPVSLTFDHRAATGGEATRFLHTLIAELEK
ncbi:branched-chain alpha-keto acid dehydrogenase subunit E2 [Endozoicomonas montiporae]|uniref:Dihydrolipoamide acetyltransferase component of pyruvate dehydrogenase complex n=2 Tax=Endozoicomonas montiporae TaxID=1027273 RepID=A0A081N1P0_9GAMM|nr:dihydrolipoamide acetyltransferase family protein [Endozoicomonas montiporae]AMO58703.1 branched-chain alpha-keto acid dehydrogenase subunit E2 [Endozoicomonas montiporae CL-33]KEQ12363.1 branched-chain alpha-keto acid dehydrogenase subunit E2 [Endozoicomonas montiporae]